MRAATPVWVLAAALSGAIVAPAGAAAPTQATHRSAASASKPVVVTMTGDNLVFEPMRVVIKRGQTIEWVNQSRVVHTVTFDPRQADNKTDVELPVRAKPFDSGYMNPGQTFSHRFTVRGTYRYVCLTHEGQRMLGEVVVH